jgi:hypothetical protein
MPYGECELSVTLLLSARWTYPAPARVQERTGVSSPRRLASLRRRRRCSPSGRLLVDCGLECEISTFLYFSTENSEEQVLGFTVFRFDGTHKHREPLSRVLNEESCENYPGSPFDLGPRSEHADWDACEVPGSRALNALWVCHKKSSPQEGPGR